MPSVLSIGTFDGVHQGHRALLARGRQCADADSDAPGPGTLTVLAFDPHPLAVLKPGSEPARLTTFEHRALMLREAGADRVVRLDPTPDLLSLTPEQFIQGVVRDYSPDTIVEGHDFGFGRARQGDVQTLIDLGRKYNFRGDIVPPVEVALSDLTMVTASSSITRWLIRHGRVRDAAIVLGRPYSITGRVVRGDRRGRDLGFPTANISTECLIPAQGIYAGIARLDNGHRHVAAIHVGARLTFDDAVHTVEAHLLNVPTDGGSAIEGLPEYGWTIELSFVAWLRDQMKFDSVPALVDQMMRDCDRAARIPDAAGTVRGPAHASRNGGIQS
jgi:riboflavin kinase/FMN adenylyltransferase